MSNRFGNDLILNDGDIVTTNGDLYTASDYEKANASESRFDGYHNIMFSLFDRIMSVKGDNVFHSSYGSDIQSLVSSPNSANSNNVLADSVRNSILQDPRVSDVASVNVTQNGNRVTINVSVVLFGRNSVDEFVYPNIVLS